MAICEKGQTIVSSDGNASSLVSVGRARPRPCTGRPNVADIGRIVKVLCVATYFVRLLKGACLSDDYFIVFETLRGCECRSRPVRMQD